MKRLVYAMMMGLLSTTAHATIEAGVKAPQMDLPHIGAHTEKGAVIGLTTPRQPGQKVLLEFFSITCDACEKNIPNFKDMQTEFGNTVTFKKVGIDRNEADSVNYAQKHPDVTVVIDNHRQAMKAYDIMYTPTTFIINENGDIVYMLEGSWSFFNKMKIREILGQ